MVGSPLSTQAGPRPPRLFDAVVHARTFARDLRGRKTKSPRAVAAYVDARAAATSALASAALAALGARTVLLLADDATVVNVSSRQAARTLGFLEPRHRDAFEANDIEAVRRAAYEVADLLDDDYGPYTTLATPAHGLSKCALNAWTRIMARQRPEMRFLAVAPGQLRTRHNPVVWEGGLRPRPPRLGARVVVCLLYTSPSPRDKRQSRMPSSA